MITKDQVSKHSTIKQFSKDIAHYLGEDWDDAYYQRTRSILSGDTKSYSAQEEAVMNFWVEASENPHKYGKVAYSLMNERSTLKTIKRWLQTGTYNFFNARKAIDRVISHLPD